MKVFIKNYPVFCTAKSRNSFASLINKLGHQSICNDSLNAIFDLLIELLKLLNILIRGFPITTTMHL